MRLKARLAIREDENWLYQLHDDAHRALVEAAYGPWVEVEQVVFFRALVDEHAVSILVVDGVDVGAVYLGSRDGDTWLELIEVLPGRQGEGIGAAALRSVVRESNAVCLQVHRLNDGARRLYEREGFVLIGETPTHFLLRHG